MRVCQFRHFGTSNSRFPGAKVDQESLFCPAGCWTAAVASLAKAVGKVKHCRQRNGQRDAAAACRLHHNARERGIRGMTDTDGATPTPLLQADAKEIRRLTHDMNNALEIIVQASYLVNTTALSDQAREWMKLLDMGIEQATGLNRELREFVRMRS